MSRQDNPVVGGNAHFISGGKQMETLKKDKELILSIQHVSKSFPGVKALDDVSMDIEKGVVYGIVGETGAGKSTLMKILSGVYTKDEGKVFFDGKEIEHTTPMESLRMGLSIIYQEFSLVQKMTVGENIYLGRFKEAGGMSGTHAKAREMLDRIGSKINTRSYVGDLSTSEMQMVEIAKALSFDSKCIIMDEPSSSLTNEELVRLGEIIKDLRSRGITIIYISHKLNEIFEYCDVVSIMRDGRVIDTKPTTELTRDEMIAKMIGRKIENEYPERPHCVGGPLLEVKHLNTMKLKDVSFTLNSGEILGFVGLVGAGRTEIVRAITGADKVRGHEIVLEGNAVTIKNPKDSKKAGIGFIPEDRKLQGLVLPFTVEENIAMATLENKKKGIFLDASGERQMAEDEVKALSIKTPSVKTKVKSLSGGNQQKVVIGRWLETNPKILIMDDPTRGIDVGAKYEIYLLMKNIVENGGSIILISSELPEVLNMSNRVLTICEGRITGEFDPETIPSEVIMAGALG